MRFLALSVVAPAGSKIASGAKTLEIRSWKPPIVPLRNLLIVENHRRLDREGDVDPDGMAVALVDIDQVRAWTPEDAARDGHAFVTGYHAWVISNPRALATPVRVPAERLIYEVAMADGAVPAQTARGRS